jgi:hypothetical protein
VRHADNLHIGRAPCGYGTTHCERPPLLVRSGQRGKYFSENPAEGEMLNDSGYDFDVYLLGCLMDRQMSAERAWVVPAIVRKRLGTSGDG